MPVAGLDIGHPAATAGLRGRWHVPARSSGGGAGFNLLISNDFRNLALKWRHSLDTPAKGSPGPGATSRRAAFFFASPANRWHVPLFAASAPTAATESRAP